MSRDAENLLYPLDTGDDPVCLRYFSIQPFNGDKRTRPSVPRRPDLAGACTAVHRPRFDRDAHGS
jgi:hypothetical protein